MTNEERKEAIRAALEQSFTVAALTIRDDSARHIGHPRDNDGGHFAVRIVSEAFAGKSRLTRHQMVYRSLAELMGNEIHALAIKAKTPFENGND